MSAELDVQQFVKDIKELIFVVMEGREGGQIAIEANVGLVAFGETRIDLLTDIKDKVKLNFNADFSGQIIVYEFGDTVIRHEQPGLLPPTAQCLI